MEGRDPDFSGWATKADIRCTDGRTIMQHAFAHQDKTVVPLVWQHQRNDPDNTLGEAHLEDRAFGVYTYGYFDEDHPKAQKAKRLVKSGRLDSLSIYATGLSQREGNVYYGDIEEVSLVDKGANPGAFIDNINLMHGDGSTPFESEAIIYTGLTLEHQDQSQEGGSTVAEENQDEKTVEDVFNSLSDEQKNVVYFMIGQALEDAGVSSDDNEDKVEHGDEGTISTEDFLAHIDQTITKGIKEMGNIWADNADTKDKVEGGTLSHADFSDIVAKAQKAKTDSLMDYVLEHADYGIEQIEYLFPDAKALSNQPDYISRRMEWVNVVLTGTKHSPFAKVKTLHADITEPEARAKGYIKGSMKKEEVFKLLKRTTGPTTIYKKQKLDRDDIIDITDIDVVNWLRQEMRLMLEEEIARSILVGDGRSAMDPDKVKDPEGAPSGDGIRSIFHDHELYAHKVSLAANVSPKDAVKGLVRARRHFKGSGKPTLFISDAELTEILLEEDKFGRALYATEQELADKLRVSSIVSVEIFDEYEGLFAIMVNLQDYTVGSNKGGEITDMQQFDIDFNQNKFLSETRISGGLTKPKSALVVTRAQGTATTPEAPTFADNTITIVATTGVDYLINDEVVTGSVAITQDTEVTAEAKTGYYIPAGNTRSWSFTYTA